MNDSPSNDRTDKVAAARDHYSDTKVRWAKDFKEPEILEDMSLTEPPPPLVILHGVQRELDLFAEDPESWQMD